VGGGGSPGLVTEEEDLGVTIASGDGTEGFGIRDGPLSDTTLQRGRNRATAESRADWGVRPVRLKAVGQLQEMSEADKAFLDRALKEGWTVCYLQNNPKRGKSRDRYQRYMVAETLQEALDLGASWQDIIWDYKRSFIFFPSHESSDMAGCVGTEVEKIARLSEEDSRVRGDSAGLAYHATSQLQQFLSQAFRDEELPVFLRTKRSMQQEAESQFSDIMVAAATLPDFDPDAKVPRRPDDIRKSPQKELWEAAVVSELDGMQSAGTHGEWMTVDQARRRDDFTQPLGTMYDFKIKIKDGKPIKYKARCVVRGDLATPGIHYDMIFAPTAAYDSVRIICSIAAAEGMDLYQSDISQAFLQAKIDKDVWIKRPWDPRYPRQGGPPMVAKLHKSLYGLPSSPRSWYLEYSNYLIDHLGFRQLTGDCCVFIKEDGKGSKIITSCFVNDVLCATNDVDMRKWFINKLKERYPVHDNEEANWLLGIKIERTPSGITLSQKEAISKLAETCKLNGPEYFHDSPMLPDRLPWLEEPDPEVNPDRCINGLSYRSVVGSVLYFALCTRPDIAAAVAILARHSARPGRKHVEALKRLVGYFFLGCGLRHEPQSKVYDGLRGSLEWWSGYLEFQVAEDHCSVHSGERVHRCHGMCEGSCSR